MQHLNRPIIHNTTRFFYLSEEQLHYLKYKKAGLNQKLILNKMKISCTRGLWLKSSIQKKFETDNWLEIFISSFEKGILNPLDFIDGILKETSLEFASRLVNECEEEESQSNYIKFQDIHYLLRNFITTVKKASIHRENPFELSKKQTTFLIHQYNNGSFSHHNTDVYSKRMFFYYQRQLFKILAVNNWDDGLKKIFKIGTLKLSTKDEGTLIDKHSENIKLALCQKNISKKNKEFLCFNELALLYTNIEIQFLKGHITTERFN